MSFGLDRAGVVSAGTGGRSERARTVVYQQSASGDYRSVPGVATDGLPLPAWAHLDPQELPGIDATRASATRGTKKGTEVAAKYAVTGVTTSDQQWGRVGVAVKLASTSSETFGTVTVRFWVARVSCGMAVGSVSAMLNPATSQQNAVFVVGGPVPTLGITAFKAAVMVQGLTGGSVKGQLVVRLYATDLEKPGPWLALETLRTFTTDDEVNTGELDPTGLTGWGAAMFCEIGYQAQPQTANVQATVKVSAVAKL